MNDCSCRTVRQTLASGLFICTALATLALPITAQAQFSGKASATAQFESNSNVFALESGAAQPGVNESGRSDTYFAYGADFSGSYAWGRQQLYAAASVKEFDYQRFTELDHNAFTADVGLLWRLGDSLDGKVDVARTRSMVPLYDLTGSVLGLSLLTQQIETLQVGLKLSSDWKIAGLASTSEGDEPVAGAPNLQLKQTSGSASIDYVGIGGLTTGLTAGYSTGDYTGAIGTANPTYSQSSAGLLASYRLTRMTFDGDIGYSRRTSDTGTDSTSGVTGLLDLKYQLTPKTSYTVKIDRTINSYYLNASSEIDTDAGASVSWQATYKLTVSAGYTFSYRDFPGQGNDPPNSNRQDFIRD